jgi:exodeoxyribonuclease VII small subunit
MTDERYTFEAARVRLEEIATLARKKDTSLEKSLDLLEEGVRLANICTELVDHTDLSATVAVEMPDELPAEVGPVEAVAEPADVTAA